MVKPLQNLGEQMLRQVIVVVFVASALGNWSTYASTSRSEIKKANAEQDRHSSILLSENVLARDTVKANKSAEREIYCGAEVACLAKLGGIAKRSGKTLNLKLDNSSIKSFRSTDGCEVAGESCELTSLAGYLPSPRLFVLSANYYESFASLLVNQRTGDVFRIDDAKPHFSPDEAHFVVAAHSEQDGINEITLYKTGAFPPVLEWKHVPKGFSKMFDFVSWNGNDQVRLRELDRDLSVTLSRTQNGWSLSPY